MKNLKIENTRSQKLKVLPLPCIENHKALTIAYQNMKKNYYNSGEEKWFKKSLSLIIEFNLTAFLNKNIRNKNENYTFR